MKKIFFATMIIPALFGCAKKEKAETATNENYSTNEAVKLFPPSGDIPKVYLRVAAVDNDGSENQFPVVHN